MPDTGKGVRPARWTEGGETATSDGAAVGYIVTLADGTDPEFLRQVSGEDGWTTVSINAFEEPE